MDKDKECYIQAPGAKILKSSIRKSSRLLIKNKLSSCSQDILKSHKNTFNHAIKSSKTSLHGKNLNSEENGVFLTDTTSMKSSTVVPSFKYHIGAKDGIRLIVDLNLNRSDWLRSLEKTVCVCQNHLKPKFGSFRKELECLGGKNNHESSSPDKNTLSDASLNSCVQNKFPIKSTSEEIETPLSSKRHWSKFDQSSEHLENVAISSEKDSSCLRTGNRYLEKEERINPTEGMEVSGEENVPKRKKRCRESGQIHGQSHDRILRSTKLFGAQILESGGLFIRRSSRLHSK